MLRAQVVRHLKAAKKRVTANCPPYEYVQEVVERNLHRYLGLAPADVREFYIVGGYYGFECNGLLRRYPKVDIHIFEPSQRYFGALSQRFSTEKRVTCVNAAVGDKQGRAAFYETNLEGSGSLLTVNESGLRDYGMRQGETFEVECIDLDGYCAAHPRSDDMLDLLWCDVQGVEMMVFRGAQKTLAKCRAVFTEVSVYEPSYRGGCVMNEIEQFINPVGFRLALIGTDPLNGTGNALFVNSALRGQNRQGW